MAEEFLQGGVCGGSWWNSPRNLFSSSPCSLASNDGFGWASHELMTAEIKSVGSTDDSASDGSSGSAAVVQDVHNPDGIALSSSTTHWINQDLL